MKKNKSNKIVDIETIEPSKLRSVLRSSRMQSYLSEGKFTAMYRGKAVILDDNDFMFVVDGNLVYDLKTHIDDHSDMYELDADRVTLDELRDDECVCGVVIKSLSKKHKYNMATSADNDILIACKEGIIPLSWIVVSRFLTQDQQPNPLLSSQALLDGSIEIIDATGESFLPVDKKTKAAFRRLCNTKSMADALGYVRNYAKKPPLGYTLLATMHWHRSPYVLMRIKRRKETMSILVGQDDGTYFGCLLSDNPKNVSGALLSLVPKSLRGKKYERQGEWFISSVRAKNVPSLSDSVTSDSLVLPREDGGRRHTLHGVDDCIRVGKNNRVFATDAILVHTQHINVSLLKGRWYTFDKNTAVLSFLPRRSGLIGHRQNELNSLNALSYLVGTPEFESQVRNSTLPGMSLEGVVCKGRRHQSH